MFGLSGWIPQISVIPLLRFHTGLALQVAYRLFCDGGILETRSGWLLQQETIETDHIVQNHCCPLRMDFKLSDACVECRDSIAYHAVVSWRYAWNILEGSMYAHDCQAISMCRRARTYTIYPQTQTFVLFISLINAIWLFNIAMENPKNKWRFLAGKIIYKWAIFHGYVK